MAQERVLISGQLLSRDSETGALLVSVGGVTLSIDIGDADIAAVVQGLIDGIAGPAGATATQKQILTALANVANIPAKGQALAAASLPVVLTAAQEAMLAVHGSATDTPSTDAEDATARTGISLWKGIKNFLRSLAGCVAGSEVQVDVVASALPSGAATAGNQQPSLDLANAAKAVKHVHTAAGTAEEKAGATAFDNGATVEIVGINTWVAWGSSKADAETNAKMNPAGVPVRVKLAATTIWIDAASSGIVSIRQV